MAEHVRIIRTAIPEPAQTWAEQLAGARPSLSLREPCPGTLRPADDRQPNLPPSSMDRSTPG